MLSILVDRNIFKIDWDIGDKQPTQVEADGT